MKIHKTGSISNNEYIIVIIIIVTVLLLLRFSSNYEIEIPTLNVPAWFIQYANLSFVNAE